MKVIIFSSPSRKRMLNRLLKELDGFDVSIINDPETFGKRNFWKRYKKAFDICLESEYDWFLFLPDDVRNIRLDIMTKWMERTGTSTRVLNLINDGRTHCWGKLSRTAPDIEINGVTFTDRSFYDCGGLINRATLSLVDIDPVKDSWFEKHGENISSGVGFQLTGKFRRKYIPMYVPSISLAYHGEHESIMHPNERTKNKLVSK